ncbi:hypothetical protein TGDOM2_285272 [Toxoplasma gondii GAB2-2007-GAL-DOM2]|uniref:FAS1 domain-containing protein n=3 Tax=Toxoplasma gondii TaxID=5811 RepID=V4Z5D2_TOXGV|nr:hypothetical protein TGVEG_285272 [Toxoplasma gondii VEG]KFG39890.1 hypothetical protein TGDOM2_285272 [Toxoplasma gondii GAB2-2007-GAL-DOM2]KFG45115.1 hypothetical protein TGP89_285272 [Toxoplasma gondii p89]CEL72985.1 TPA: hypothetical protein BN1205_032760 [Toxoplasma gondii VEG]
MAIVAPAIAERPLRGVDSGNSHVFCGRRPVPRFSAFPSRLHSARLFLLPLRLAAKKTALPCCSLHRSRVCLSGSSFSSFSRGLQHPKHAPAEPLGPRVTSALHMSGTLLHSRLLASSVSGTPRRLAFGIRGPGRRGGSSGEELLCTKTAPLPVPPHLTKPFEPPASLQASSSACSSALLLRGLRQPSFHARCCSTRASLSATLATHASVISSRLRRPLSSSLGSTARVSLSPSPSASLASSAYSLLSNVWPKGLASPPSSCCSVGSMACSFPPMLSHDRLPLSFSLVPSSTLSGALTSPSRACPAAGPLCALSLPAATSAGSFTNVSVAVEVARSPVSSLPTLAARSCMQASGEEPRLLAGVFSQQKRWWTRASGMRNPVKWTRDWEVLNRKVYFAFDEREIRRSMLDAVSAHRKTASLFHRMINAVPGVAHAMSLPGPHTFFLPSDKACRDHLSPDSLHALTERVAFLEEQQRQRVGARVQVEGGVSVRGGTAAAIADRVAKTTEQLRTFVLAHLIPGEWRMKTLLLACGAGDPRRNGSLRYQDTDRELFAPVMYASRLGTGEKTKRKQTASREGVEHENAQELGRTRDEETDRSSVFLLPPPQSTDEPLPVWVQASRYAAFLPITTSTNFPRFEGTECRGNSDREEAESVENSGEYSQRRSTVGGALHLWVGGALVTKGDLRAHNGVVHMIDKPLIPVQLLASPR